MGYRLSLNDINAIGNLVEGNVTEFLEQTLRSKDVLESNIKTLDKLINSTNENLLVSPDYFRHIERNLYKLQAEWDTTINDLGELALMRRSKYEETDLNLQIYGSPKYHPLLEYIRSSSELFTACKVKTILLPGFDRSNPINSLMCDKRVLEALVGIHPGDTALIIQLEDIIEENAIEVLNVFPNFEKALTQMDKWPGIFAWDQNDSIFIPISSEADLTRIYTAIRYNKSPLRTLRSMYGDSDKDSVYFLHLSDLHFGKAQCNTRSTRLINILKKHSSILNDAKEIIPIISGDMLDSPTEENLNEYQKFILMLDGIENSSSPIEVLGNHDVDSSGILRLLDQQKGVISTLSTNDQVVIRDDISVIFIKFNSNTGGSLARGEIGDNQLAAIGDQLDRVENIENYSLVAILHHHPIEIQNPPWYAKNFIEKILGTKFNKTMRLDDADKFLQWSKARGIDIILHGHKHIPIINRYEGIPVIAAGSATGNVLHTDKGKTYMSYNLIKYNVGENRPVSCTIFAEDIIGAGSKSVYAELLTR